MVSFSCEVCNDTVVKKKLDQHSQRCYGAYFTCIDCSTTFQGTSYRAHTSCISEAEKYEKALYKGPKQKKQHQYSEYKSEPVQESVDVEEPVQKEKEYKKRKGSKKIPSLAQFLDSKKEENLYKIVKKLSKDNSEGLKQVLKNLKITKNEVGQIVIS